MQYVSKINTAVTSSDFESEDFTIKSSPIAFELLSSGLYSDKIAAVIRELACNAQDSHTEAKVDLPIVIHFPSKEDNIFYVEDFGIGMTEKEVYTLYTSYFSSSKRNSNDQTGVFGIGSKSPFAYKGTDSFTITVVYDGIRKIFNCFLNEERKPKVLKLFEEVTTAHNGLKVAFPVLEKDIDEFITKGRKIVASFEKKPTILNTDKIKPSVYEDEKLISCGIDQPILFKNEFGRIVTPTQVHNYINFIKNKKAYINNAASAIQNSDDKEFIERLNNFDSDIEIGMLNNYSSSLLEITLVMGNITYPVDRDYMIEVLNKYRAKSNSVAFEGAIIDAFFSSYRVGLFVQLKVPIGTVEVLPSREGLPKEEATYFSIIGYLMRLLHNFVVYYIDKIVSVGKTNGEYDRKLYVHSLFNMIDNIRNYYYNAMSNIAGTKFASIKEKDDFIQFFRYAEEAEKMEQFFPTSDNIEHHLVGGGSLVQNGVVYKNKFTLLEATDVSSENPTNKALLSLTNLSFSDIIKNSFSCNSIALRKKVYKKSNKSISVKDFISSSTFLFKSKELLSYNGGIVSGNSKIVSLLKKKMIVYIMDYLKNKVDNSVLALLNERSLKASVANAVNRLRPTPFAFPSNVVFVDDTDMSKELKSLLGNKLVDLDSYQVPEKYTSYIERDIDTSEIPKDMEVVIHNIKPVESTDIDMFNPYYSYHKIQSRNKINNMVNSIDISFLYENREYFKDNPVAVLIYKEDHTYFVYEGTSYYKRKVEVKTPLDICKQYSELQGDLIQSGSNIQLPYVCTIPYKVYSKNKKWLSAVTKPFSEVLTEEVLKNIATFYTNKDKCGWRLSFYNESKSVIRRLFYMQERFFTYLNSLYEHSPMQLNLYTNNIFKKCTNPIFIETPMNKSVYYQVMKNLISYKEEINTIANKYIVNSFTEDGRRNFLSLVAKLSYLPFKFVIEEYIESIVVDDEEKQKLNDIDKNITINMMYAHSTYKILHSSVYDISQLIEYAISKQSHKVHPDIYSTIFETKFINNEDMLQALLDFFQSKVYHEDDIEKVKVFYESSKSSFEENKKKGDKNE